MSCKSVPKFYLFIDRLMGSVQNTGASVYYQSIYLFAVKG